MEIPCEFEQIAEWTFFKADEKVKKSGRYDSTNLPVKGLGFDKWALVANILLPSPLAEYLSSGMDEQGVVDACIEHLNKPPTRRSRKPKYGQLECRFFNVLSPTKISVSLLTSERNSKHFWGRGNKNSPARKITKRGRLKKSK